MERAKALSGATTLLLALFKEHPRCAWHFTDKNNWRSLPPEAEITQTQHQTTMSAAAESRSAAAVAVMALAKEHGLHPLSHLLLHLTCPDCSHGKFFFSNFSLSAQRQGQATGLTSFMSNSLELKMAPGQEPSPRRTCQQRGWKISPGWGGSRWECRHGGEDAAAAHRPHGQQTLPRTPA